MSSPKRGQCATCRYRWRLRKDGTMQEHHLYSGRDRVEEPCAGSGKSPAPFDPNQCGDCLVHAMNPLLVEACASAGIEHGKSTETMMWDYLVQYHERGHQVSS